MDPIHGILDVEDLEKDEAVAATLEARAGEDGYFWGMSGYTPFLFRQLDAYASAYVFKIRLIEDAAPDDAWIQILPQAYAEAKISCEFEDGYTFLWVEAADYLEPAAIAVLLPFCIQSNPDVYPSDENYCYLCKTYGSGVVTQSQENISTVCPECLSEIEHAAAVVDKNDLVRSKVWKPLLPVMIVLAALGWAFTWTLINHTLSQATPASPAVPREVMVWGIVVIGLVLGCPTAWVINRSGIIKGRSSLPIAVGGALAVSVLGECFCASFFLYQEMIAWSVDAILQVSGLFAIRGGVFYMMTKLMSVGAIGWMIYEFCKDHTRLRSLKI